MDSSSPSTGGSERNENKLTAETRTKMATKTDQWLAAAPGPAFTKAIVARPAMLGMVIELGLTEDDLSDDDKSWLRRYFDSPDRAAGVITNPLPTVSETR